MPKQKRNDKLGPLEEIKSGAEMKCKSRKLV